MITIKVIHVSEIDKVHVATVISPSNTISGALEEAYYRTQNISGSWSKGQFLKLQGGLVENPDYSPTIQVVEPLYVDKDDNEWGHRSSMVGDIFEITNTDEIFICDTFGFRKAD